MIALQELRHIGFMRSDEKDEEEGKEKPVTRKTVYIPGGILYN